MTITFDQTTELGVVAFLNYLAYIKEKQAYEKELIKAATKGQ